MERVIDGPISTEYFEKVYMNEEKDEATVGSHESKALSYLFIYIKDSPLKTLVIRSLLETIYLRLSLVSFHCTRLHFQLFEDDILLVYSILFFKYKM